MLTQFWRNRLLVISKAWSAYFYDKVQELLNIASHLYKLHLLFAFSLLLIWNTTCLPCYSSALEGYRCSWIKLYAFRCDKISFHFYVPLSGNLPGPVTRGCFCCYLICSQVSCHRQFFEVFPLIRHCLPPGSKRPSQKVGRGRAAYVSDCVFDGSHMYWITRRWGSNLLFS